LIRDAAVPSAAGYSDYRIIEPSAPSYKS